MEWTHVDNQLPPIGVEVIVYGIIDPFLDQRLTAEDLPLKHPTECIINKF